MKIEKAIEFLEAVLRDEESVETIDGEEALKLGIEALERLELWRECGDDVDRNPLPGETEE